MDGRFWTSAIWKIGDLLDSTWIWGPTHSNAAPENSTLGKMSPILNNRNMTSPSAPLAGTHSRPASRSIQFSTSSRMTARTTHARHSYRVGLEKPVFHRSSDSFGVPKFVFPCISLYFLLRPLYLLLFPCMFIEFPCVSLHVLSISF